MREGRPLIGKQLGLLNDLLDGLRLRAVAQSFSALAEGALEASILVLVARLGVNLLEGGTQTITLPLFGVVSGFSAVSILGILILARFVSGVLTGFLNAGISTSITVGVRRGLLDRYSVANFSLFQRVSDAELQQLMVVWPQQIGSLMSTLLSHLSNALIMLVMLAFAFSSDPLVSLAIIALIVGMTALFVPLRRAITSASSKVMQQQNLTSGAVFELSALRLEGDSFGVTDELSNDCALCFRDEASARFRSMFTKSVVAPLYTAVTFFLIAASFYLATRVDRVEVASVGPIFLIVLRSLGYGQGLQQAGSTISTLKPVVHSLSVARASFEASRAPRGRIEVRGVESVEIRDVSFTYHGSREASLRSISLVVERGQRIGIVGPSGSGKSTLVRLLLGVLDASSGEVCLNGIPIGDVRETDLRRLIAYVPQKVGVLTGSVDENVRFRRQRISNEDISWSLGMSDLAREVERLEDGSRTMLTNSRDRLSGGQIQRLGIARALAGHPDVVVMDEPTSSVDRASERAIVDSLRGLPSSTTLIIVSHRLELLRDCAKLMVMESGRLVASGPPSELFRTNEYLRGLNFNA